MKLLWPYTVGKYVSIGNVRQYRRCPHLFPPPHNFFTRMPIRAHGENKANCFAMPCVGTEEAPNKDDTVLINGIHVEIASQVI